MIELLVDEAELKRRESAETAAKSIPERGYARLYDEQILQADEGCDFRFLRPSGAS